jgi:hypothetical protein
MVERKMKQTEMVITVTKSMTLTLESETVETVKTFEIANPDGRRELIRRESSKTEMPLSFPGGLSGEAA